MTIELPQEVSNRLESDRYGWLTTVAKFLPLTHALALMRYAFVDPSGKGLHDIWGMSNVTVEAWLSLGVVALFAAALSATMIATGSSTRRLSDSIT